MEDSEIKKYDPDFEEDSFDPDEEVEILDNSALLWNRKKLRVLSEKTGARIVADDDVLTAVETDYIDYGDYLEKNASGIDAGADEPGPDQDGREDGQKDCHDDPDDDQEDEQDDSVSAGLFQNAETTERNYVIRAAEDLIMPEDAELKEPPKENTVLDYDDIFQDDPELTRKKHVRKKIFSVLKEALKCIVIFTLVFAVVIFGYLTWTVYVSRTNYVYGSSMEPTLHNGDKVKSTLMPYVFGSPRVGDIVIIDMTRIEKGGFGFFERLADVLKNNKHISNTLFNGDEPDTLYIKRVVAVAGDVVEFKDDKFFRNGEQVEEDYLYDQLVVNYPNGTKLTVPDGCIYVMGDNRNVSHDSRALGVIPEYVITGKMK